MKTPCIFRVYFAPQLGYAPLRYERVVEATRELASSMRVNRYSVLEIKRYRLAIPIDVTFKQSDKDGVGRASTWNWKVAEGTLKVNHDIDDALFTIDERKAKEVLDFDKVTRGLRK